MKTLFIFLIFLPSLFYANTKVTLQLNWLNQFQFAGYYIAKEKGFYSDVGIDVDIKEFNTDINLLDEINSNKAQFAVGRSSLLIEKINGKNIVALAAIFQNSPLMLLVRENSNIKRVEDLKNKKIMITTDAKMSASILAMLYSHGLNPNDYKVQKHSFNLEDLISGKTDAMGSYLSNEPIRLEDKNIKYNILHPKDSGFDFYSDILFTSSKFIDKNPKLTEDFYTASIKGWKYAFNNMAETADLIYKKYNTQNKSLIHLLKEGEVLKKLAFHEDGEIGCLDESKLKDIVNVFKVLGITNTDTNIDEFIYENNNHKRYRFEISYEESKIILLISVFVILIILVILYFLAKNKESRELLHTVINSTDDMVFYKDKNFKYLGCNESFQKFVNKEESEIIGKDDFNLFNVSIARMFRKQDIKILKDKEQKVYEDWVIYDDNEVLFQTKKIFFSYNKSSKNGILAISRDITALYKIQKKLKEQSYIDELTQVYNRKSYNRRIKESLDSFKRYKTKFCIAMFDIDDFKSINDTYGHDIGDKVLTEMTKEIQSYIRKTDFLFRVGGEEFVILFPNSVLDEAHIVCEKIRKKVSELKMIDNRVVTISIGVTQVKQTDTSKDIYERVDKLMYLSKHNGKNQSTIE
ncbi:ABC transporter substrate-binding protein [Poseidonibacter sp.]|uniref:ABC transporter substrate-binding protein n=1 Tax=Poseidonibacter sp. TaxID=2321188 RepID=UPI003C7161A1